MKQTTEQRNPSQKLPGSLFAKNTYQSNTAFIAQPYHRVQLMVNIFTSNVFYHLTELKCYCCTTLASSKNVMEQIS